VLFDLLDQSAEIVVQICRTKRHRLNTRIDLESYLAEKHHFLCDVPPELCREYGYINITIRARIAFCVGAKDDDLRNTDTLLFEQVNEFSDFS